MGRSSSRWGSPGVAAVLSFLLPGLGQAAARRYRRGLLVSVPALAILGLLLLALADKRSFVGALLNREWLALFLALDLLLLAYHVWAILDAYRIAGGTRLFAPGAGVVRSSAAGLLFVLVFTTVGVHGAVASFDRQLDETLGCVFNPAGPVCFADASLAPTASPSPEASEETPTPIPTETPYDWSGEGAGPTVVAPTLPPTPPPTPAPVPRGPVIPVYPVEPMPASQPLAKDWPKDGFLNVVLVGSDAGAGRWSLRTDIMILLRVDLATGRAAMYGIPRNLYNVPLGAASASAFACHCFPYPNMLNALYRYAIDHPSQFPGGDIRGFRALEGAVGALTGVQVDGSIVINLMGFVKLVDALGGVDITVPYRVYDPAFPRPDGPGTTILNISAGFHHFNGYDALAYARTRHQDSDYGRMQRQQILLFAMRKTVKPCTLAPKMPNVLAAIKGTFWTDIPIADAGKLLFVAEHVGAGNTAGYTLIPPVYPEFLDVATVGKIKNLVAHGFDRMPSGGNVSGGSSC